MRSRSIAVAVMVTASVVVASVCPVGATPDPDEAGRAAVSAAPPLDVVETVLPQAPYLFGIAVDPAGRVYVEEAFGRVAIMRYDLDGTKHKIPEDGRRYLGPVGIGADGTVFILRTDESIDQIDPDGTRTKLPIPDNFLPSDIAVDDDGSLWLIESGELWHRSTSGALTKVVISGLSWPGSVEVGVDGTLYVADGGKVVRRPDTGAQQVLSMGPVGEYAFGLGLAGDGTVSILDDTTVVSRSPSGTVVRTVMPDLMEPYGIASGIDGTIYIADYATGVVTVRPPTGPDRILGEYGLRGAEVKVGPDGTVWTASEAGILRLATDGTVTHIPLPGNAYPNAFALGPDGTLYVGLGGYSAPVFIYRLPVSGPATTFLAEGLEQVAGIAVAPDGTLYVTDGNVRSRSTSGVWRTVLQGEDIASIVVDGGGVLYLTDEFGEQVRRITATGEIQTVVLPGTAKCGLTVDGSGSLYGFDCDQNPVVDGPWVLPRGGTASEFVDWVPEVHDNAGSLAIGSDGSLYVATALHGLVHFHSSTTAVPAAPLIGAVRGSSGQVTVDWTVPPDHGSPITGYTVTPFVDGVAQGPRAVGSATTSLVVDGLTNGATYTFAVTATNALGSGPASSASDAVTPGAPPYAPFTTWDVFAARQLADLGWSAGTTSSRSTTVASLAAGRLTPASYIDGLRRGPWFDGHAGPVTRLYIAYFRRSPDYGGFRYWLGRHRSGTSTTKISATFAASSEFIRTYGALSNAKFVDLVYQNVFGRPPDASGRSYWTRRLDDGLSRGSLMASFAASSEFVRTTTARVAVIEVYEAMLHRPPTKAEVDAGLGHSITTVIDAIRRSSAYAATI